ncbi:hypothetical protein Pmob_0931 [Petrotoga mobilis SJ95]|uniref:EpsG family protein n=2 Tax=Petrotoga TaxID=28236 RepID=A9BJR1_PETMO|nr:hypothetical protein Pmob_0931 [Petrotoga mobilis SJ95]
MILGLLFSLQHLISILIYYNKKYKFFFIVSSIMVFMIIYFLKPDTYDIPSYVAAVDYPYFEPLFSFLIILLRSFFNNRNVILVIQFLIGILTYLSIRLYIKSSKNKVNKCISLIFAFFSTAFTLGVNNGLRQYMASLIVFIAIWFFLNNKIIYSLIIFAFAPFIHLSSSMFYFLVIFIIYFAKKRYFFKEKHPLSLLGFSLNINLVRLLFLSISIVLIILLPIIISYTYYATYLNFNITEGRIDFTIKYLPILLIFLLSEYYFGKIKKEDYIFSQLRIVRAFFIIFMFMFIFFNTWNEMASRILSFYFTLEMFILSLSYVKGYRRGALIINLSYAFAINAINVIGKI